YGARNAVGTSLGAGAIMSLLEHDPGRFDRIVMLLPSSLDVPFRHPERFDGIADILETYPRQEAIARILEMNGERYERAPWLRAFDLALWEDMNTVGVARAIREVTRDVSISDRALLRNVEASVLLICRAGDRIHPAELGVILDDLFPNSELITLASEEELLASIPILVERVRAFLEGS
ncbi:MAG TPA: alpha/beta hydrolase, partial [Actinomycetota bacterium]|nr:alpha/beta hydrolase [Actinomycetota bacterium]